MKQILLFAGTTEGRLLSECLAEAGIRHTVCVATEYGELVLQEHPLVTVRCGRMGREEMAAYLREGGFAAVVDATHPYAAEVTEHIRAAAGAQGIPCLRLRRRTGGDGENGGRVFCFPSAPACAQALEKTEGNILLTTGSKELPCFCASESLRERLYVRVLPGLESIRLCAQQGIAGRQILALQGPFTAELNEALIRQYQIRCLVTKASGRAGGYPEKLEAARKAGIPVFVIGRQGDDPGDSFAEVCRKLGELCGRTIRLQDQMRILLAGVGMGGPGSLTEEVRRAIGEADILLGAERMIAPYRPRREKRACYRAEQILPYLQELQEYPAGEPLQVVILFSGDSGFYSGCQTLYQALCEAVQTGGLRASLQVLPGISAVSCLAACIGESYQDAFVGSMHGKRLQNLAGRIERKEKTFLLLSGARDVRELGRLLLEAELDRCEVTVGYQLSYPKQRVTVMTPRECCQVEEEGLYTCFVRNPQVRSRRLSHGRRDAEFIRDKVPMTKEEIREISICKLHLHENAVVYDIGSGTGSVAAEIAGLSETVQVYAIERKETALRLLAQNRERFRLDNLQIVAGEAPDGLEELPPPTHAFIGGSGGRLREILAALGRLGRRIRVVITAVSVETICELREVLASGTVENEELVQVQVSRAKRAGEHRLMLAENPVWICAFDLVPRICILESISGSEGNVDEDTACHDRSAGERERQDDGHLRPAGDIEAAGDPGSLL